MPIAMPLRDQSGVVIPHDHPELSDADAVVRRISEQQLVTHSDGKRRIASLAFNPSTTGSKSLSVDLVSLIERDGRDPKEFVTTPRWMGSVKFSVNDFRSREFLVGYEPLADNPYHGGVWGNFSNSKRKELSSIAQWFVEIKGVSLK